MKGFTEAGWAKYKAKFQQEFTLCPEWVKAESLITLFFLLFRLNFFCL